MTEAGLSTKVVESVSLGTSVVMNQIGDTFNYLIQGKTGFMLTGNNIEDIALLKDLCLKSKEERVELKKNCLFSKTFSIDTYSRDVL